MRTGLALVFFFIIAASFTISKAPPTEKKPHEVLSKLMPHYVIEDEDARMKSFEELRNFFKDNEKVMEEYDVKDTVKGYVHYGDPEGFYELARETAPYLLDLTWGKDKSKTPVAFALFWKYKEKIKEAKHLRNGLLRKGNFFGDLKDLFGKKKTMKREVKALENIIKLISEKRPDQLRQTDEAGYHLDKLVSELAKADSVFDGLAKKVKTAVSNAIKNGPPDTEVKPHEA